MPHKWLTYKNGLLAQTVMFIGCAVLAVTADPTPNSWLIKNPAWAAIPFGIAAGIRFGQWLDEGGKS